MKLIAEWILIYRCEIEMYGFANASIYLVSSIFPCYFLSLFFALKKQPHPVVGGTLALVKFVAAIYTVVWSLPYRKWHTELLLGYAPENFDWRFWFPQICGNNIENVAFMVIFALGIACLLINIHVFGRTKATSIPVKQD